MAEPLPSLLIQYFRLFWRYAGARILVIVGLTLVMSYAEGLGIALFFPLFTPPGSSSTDGPSQTIIHLFHFLHIPVSPAGALPLIILIFIGKGLLQYATLRYQLSLTRLVTRRLRRQALDALAHADYQHVAGTSAGYYTNLVITEVNRAAGGFLYYVKSLSPALSAATLFMMVSVVDWRLSLVCVAMGITMVGITRLSGRLIRHQSLIVSKESASLTGLIIQMLHAFKYLRTTGAYERFDSRVWGTSQRLLDADFKSSAANALLLSMSQPIMVVFLGGLLYYRAVISGEELASLFIVLLYFLRVMNEVLSLQTSWQAFCGYIGSIEVLRDATAKTEAAAERPGSIRFDGLTVGLACDHMSFAYQTGREVLKDVSLEIPKQATVAFVGESGSGKSTLVDLLTGTLKATRGAVSIDGVDMTSIDLRTLRPRLGYVPQDAVLFDDTIRNNIAMWSSSYTREQIRDAAARAKCLEFIELLPDGLDTQIGDRGVKLSGGQRQRLAIARELLRSPELLVLDEATSALDSESEIAIQQSIELLRGTMTILIIAHRLSTIRNCDRVYVVHDGRIVEAGTFQELNSLPAGRFRRMCELQEVVTATPS